ESRSTTELPTRRTVARVGVEPTVASTSSWSLCRFAYHAVEYSVRGSNPSGLLEGQATSPEVERRVSQSAWRESNPPVHRGGVVPGPLGHRRISQRKERESNPQGLVASAAFEAAAIAGLACPSVSLATPACTAVSAGCDR